MKNINISGAKNAALPMLAATLLQKNVYYIKNVPLISDIETQINILKKFNVKISRINKKKLIIDTTDFKLPESIDYSKNTRGTYYFIGSTAMYDTDLEYILDTGCKIDVRGIDFHISLLELLGKKCAINGNKLSVKGECTTNDIIYTFPKPSIGATINALFMYSARKSLIVLKNYAKDPYIINTIDLLRKIGISIEYDEESITINGHKSSPVSNTFISHSIIEDPIESLTYIIYSGINLKNDTTSNYTIGPINISNLGRAHILLEEIGIFLIESGTPGLYYIKKTNLKPFNIVTDYFPLIYTDIQPFLTLLALYVENGSSSVTETIWNERFKYVDQINKFGCNAILKENQVVVGPWRETVPENIDGVELVCTDLRGGMALLLLMRKLKIKTDPVKKSYIDRGYYDYERNISVILENSENFEHFDYNTKHLSNIKIGGVSKLYAEAFKEECILTIIKKCCNENIKYKLIGDGNNLFFCDYYDGLIIKNSFAKIDHLFVDEELCENFSVSSGSSLLDFVLHVSDYGCDLSSLAGIPGTVGGAIYGNAGAYGLEIRKIVKECKVLSTNNYSVSNFDNNMMNFKYRNSELKTFGNGIILSATIRIKKSNKSIEEIKNKIGDIVKTRNIRIPMENTLGSVFKNVEDERNSEKIYAWKLIEELDIRGKTINNITIGNSHPNIFINNDNASPRDLSSLIETISEEILKKRQIKMETEIEFIE